MKHMKTILLILATIVVGIVTCGYLFQILVAYDGTIDTHPFSWMILAPLFFLGVGAYLELTGPRTPTDKPHRIRNLIGTLIVLMCLIVNLIFYHYDLTLIVFSVLWILLHVGLIIAKRRFGFVPGDCDHPIKLMIGLLLGTYLVVLMTTLAYMQILNPLTLEEAKTLVEEEYGSGAYEYIGSSTGYSKDYPIGAYLFHPPAGQGDTIRISILGGTP